MSALASHVAQSDDFELLLQNELAGLRRVALRYTRDRAQAEDLVQDAALRALRFRDRFEPGTNFRAWMYTILTNTFLHSYRRKKRERESFEGTRRSDIEQHFVSDEAREKARAPEKTFMEQQLSDDVVASLASLSEDFRSVIVSCDLEGRTYQAAADMLDCPVGTVMSRLFRARRLLERRLSRLARERGIAVRPDLTELFVGEGQEPAESLMAAKS